MAQSISFCDMCPKPASKTCAGCSSSKYCSRTCQRRSHEQHKLFCLTFDLFNGETRPSSLHCRAIYFAVDEPQPLFIWLPFKREYEDEIDDMYDSPLRGDLLGTDTFVQLLLIRDNALLQRRLDHTITIMVREAGMIEGSAMNQSVLSMFARPLRAQCEWAGPIIAYGKKGLAVDPNESEDLDMTDFQHLVIRLMKGT